MNKNRTNSHITTETIVCLRTCMWLIIERLKTKYNNYSSFFIPVTEPDRSKLLNPEVWPTQCIVKKYCRYN